MGGEWISKRLADVATITMGQSPPGSTYNEVGDGVPFFQGVKDFTNRYPVPRVYCTAPTRFAEPGDILFSVRAPIGEINRVSERCCISRGLAAIRGKDKHDTDFLEYVLRSIRNEWHVLESQGAVFGNAKKSDLENLEIPWPEQSERRAIARILGSLDDKIELNRRMNETLEAMAQALFKSWFVDFDPVVVNALRAGNPIPEKFAKRAAHYRDNPDTLGLPEDILRLFPSRFVDSELGPIPEGWEVGCIADFGNVVCGKTPPTRDPSNYGEDVPFVTIPDMHETVYVTHTMKCLSRKGAEIQKNKYVPPNSVCVSCIATPGLVVLTSEVSQTNQQINTVIPKDISPYYVFGALRRLGQQIKAGGSGGSVFANLNKSRFSALQVLLPKKATIKAFHSAVEMWFQKILANEKQSRTLAALRDTLLPKLISGELRVPDVEKILEDVA